jgi:hypothetical protein
MLQRHLEPGLAAGIASSAYSHPCSSRQASMRRPIHQIQAPTAAAIAEDGIRNTSTFNLPGGGHEDVIEAFKSREGMTLATASTMKRLRQYGD